MKLLFMVLLSAFLSPYLAAQEPVTCDGDTLYHALDFWLGVWEVFDQKDEMIGTNHIEKVLDGCAIMEHWTGKGGGKGKSLFYVDNDTREWRQVWVTERATQPWGQKEKTLVYFERNQLLIFQGSYLINHKLAIDRTLLQYISENHIKQTIQVSVDGGQTWKTNFIGHYRKP